MYSLIRDNVEISGPMSISLYETSGVLVVKENAKPEIGGQIMVGSKHGAGYEKHDWLKTMDIIEILEDSGNKVVFKTKNNLYTWIRE